MRIKIPLMILFMLGTMLLGNTETKSIEAVGIGTTIEKAIDNAIKNAIENAMGSIIRANSSFESKTVIDGENIQIEEAYYESIKSYSKGFLNDYVIKAVEMKDDIYHVTITATIANQPLEDFIIEMDPEKVTINGEKILHQLKSTQNTTQDFEAITRHILDDVLFIQNAWEWATVKMDIQNYAKEKVEILLSVQAEPRKDFFENIPNYLQDIHSQLEYEAITETIDYTKTVKSESMLLSQFEKKDNNAPKLHFYRKSQRKKNVFDTFVLEDTENTKIFSEVLLNQINTLKPVVYITFLDERGKSILRTEQKNRCKEGYVLDSKSFGFLYTEQNNGRFFFYPGSIKSSIGRIEISKKPLIFQWEMEIPTKIFKETRELSVHIE